MNRRKCVIQRHPCRLDHQFRRKVQNRISRQHERGVGGTEVFKRNVDIPAVIESRCSDFGAAARSRQFLCRVRRAVLNNRDGNIIPKQCLEAKTQVAFDGDDINLIRDFGQEQNSGLARCDIA